jgi:hypothetical protein
MPNKKCKHSLARPVVVISQPMYFPWVGLLEQIRLADIFVHYEDVQFARGFFNRVQIKTPKGTQWMTVPLRNYHRGQKINEVLIDDRQDWRASHRTSLIQAYPKAPFGSDMLALVDQVFSLSAPTLGTLSSASIMAMVDYFGLRKGRQFLSSVGRSVDVSSSQRLHDIAASLGACTYLTGHGARNYLDHALFDRSSIAVEYMDYQCVPYPQLHGTFTPYVSALDLVANCGPDGVCYISSKSIPYREFLA